MAPDCGKRAQPRDVLQVLRQICREHGLDHERTDGRTVLGGEPIKDVERMVLHERERRMEVVALED